MMILLEIIIKSWNKMVLTLSNYMKLNVYELFKITG